jgi:hypothetical protein
MSRLQELSRTLSPKRAVDTTRDMARRIAVNSAKLPELHMWEGNADRLLFCDCRGLLLRQHTKPKNRVEPLRTLEWPHFQFPFASSNGEFCAQDIIGGRTNSLDACCSDQFESRCCWRSIRRWDRACGRWASRCCGRRRCRRYLGETVLGTAQ